MINPIRKGETKMNTKPRPRKGAINLPLAVMQEFRKACILNDKKPSEVLFSMVEAYIKVQKKKFLKEYNL